MRCQFRYARKSAVASLRPSLRKNALELAQKVCTFVNVLPSDLHQTAFGGQLRPARSRVGHQGHDHRKRQNQENPMWNLYSRALGYDLGTTTKPEYRTLTPHHLQQCKQQGGYLAMFQVHQYFNTMQNHYYLVLWFKDHILTQVFNYFSMLIYMIYLLHLKVLKYLIH